MSQEITQKPNPIDQLFGGKFTTTLNCLKCRQVKNISQKFHLLSLPIPEAEYNYYSIVAVPIYRTSLVKVVIRLHKSATVSEYIRAFQDRIGQGKSQFVFVQMMQGSLRKIKTQFIQQLSQGKQLIEIGVAPNNQIYAYEKLRKQTLNQLLKYKSMDDENTFFDYLNEQAATWTIAKVVQKKKQYIKIQFLNSENDVQIGKIALSQQKNLQSLGSKAGADATYRKIYQRKYNNFLKRYQIFGLEMIVNIPKWASYSDFVSIVETITINLKQNSYSSGTSDTQRKKTVKKDPSTIFRIVEPTKLRCIFCEKDVMSSTINLDGKPCCSVVDKQVPLPWLLKKKSYIIYVDWINFSECKASFFSVLQMDSFSKMTEQKKSEEKVNLQQCLDLFKAPEKVEMECDKCKNNNQTLQIMITNIPNILILHMKEFRYTNEGHMIKLDIRLKGLQFLDISRYSNTSKGSIYELYAYSRHSGNIQAGHYTCMGKRKHPVQSKRVWVNFDDDLTEIIKEGPHNIDNAYLLFFKKVDMPTSAYLNFTQLSNNNPKTL